MTVEIDLKLPSLNEYVRVCRGNVYAASKYVREIEDEIMWFLLPLPKFENPVRIEFLWVEGTLKRDVDNVAFGKKFILDALVKAHKLVDDSPKYVKGFRDDFEYGSRTKVIMTIKEIKDE